MGKRSRPQERFPCPMISSESLVSEHVLWRMALEIERRGAVPAGDLGNAFLASLRDVAKEPLPESAPREQRARDLVYWAFGAKSEDRATALLAAAAALAPDELMVRGEQAINVWPVSRRVVAFRPLMADARAQIDVARADLGPDVTAWDVVRLRPALRLLAGHALDLVDVGRVDEAVEAARYLLSVDPGDAQGVRYFVAPLLVEVGQLDLAQELVEAGRGIETGLDAWNRLLVQSARGAASPGDWKHAESWSPFALEFIAHPDLVEPGLPDDYECGSEDEAQIIGRFTWRAWRKAPKARDALHARIQSKRGSHRHLSLLDGRELVEAILESGLFAPGDTPGLAAYLTPPTDGMVRYLQRLTRLADDPDRSHVAAGAAHLLAAVRGLDVAEDVLATLERLDDGIDMGEETCVIDALAGLGQGVLPLLYAAVDRTESVLGVTRLARTIGRLDARGPQAMEAFRRALLVSPFEGVGLLAGLGDPTALPLLHDALAVLDEDTPEARLRDVIEAIHRLGGSVPHEELRRLGLSPELADRPEERSPDQLAAEARALPDRPYGGGLFPEWDFDELDDDPDELDGEDVGFWEPHDEPDDSIELPSLEPPSPLTLLTSRDERPGRNDPCWCGSGKKYKKCHQPVDEGENISNP